MIVISRRVGRLGNRLLLFAHFIGAAEEHGLTVCNPAFGTYAHLFPSTASDLLCRYPQRGAFPAPGGSRDLIYAAARLASEGLSLLQRRGVDTGLLRLQGGEHLDLNGDVFLDAVGRHRVVVADGWFFRNADNCIRHRETICRFLTPGREHLDRALAVVEPARGRGRLVIGVHVRRGDYATFKNGRYYYSFEQYRRVMEGAAAAFGDRDVAFLVCSDEPVPADAFAGLDVVLGAGDALTDLYSLAACDRLVGPLSTYSTWASYWGGVPLYRIEDPDRVPSDRLFRTRLELSRGLLGRLPQPPDAPPGPG